MTPRNDPAPRASVPRAPAPPRLARAELRRHLRQVARLRFATLVLVLVALVSTPVGYFVIREAAQDPIFAELDVWNLPDWAATSHQDEAYGSRWCIRECRFRERTWQSSRDVDQTNKAYAAALRRARWTVWHVTGCPAPGAEGLDSCWQRDEYVLDLWVRAAPCEIQPVRPTVGAAAPTTPTKTGGTPGTSGAPSAGPSGIPGPGCGTSIVTVKVFNRIAYQRVA